MSEAAAYSPITIDRGQDKRGGLGIALVAGFSGLALSALWLTAHASLLRVAIPAAALLVGLVLYLSDRIRYVEYSLWLWFLTPLMRRLVDWRFGYADPNFVLLCPLLVSGVAGLALIRPNRGHTTSRIPTSFILCGAAILYAVTVDVIQHPSAETIYGLADWLCPLLFGLHFCLDWRGYQKYRAAIGRTFLCAVPILGLYGAYQFFAPPTWDRYWLTNAQVNGISLSFGQPEPLLVRVWSTMNAPGPFANTMMVGLLLLLILPSRLKLPAAVTGYLSFLLSAVRTAWASWFIGLVFILKSVNPRASLAFSCVSSSWSFVSCLWPATRE